MYHKENRMLLMVKSKGKKYNWHLAISGQDLFKIEPLR